MTELIEELDSWVTHAYIESWIDKQTENQYRKELQQILDNQEKAKKFDEIKCPKCDYGLIVDEMNHCIVCLGKPQHEFISDNKPRELIEKGDKK